MKRQESPYTDRTNLACRSVGRASRTRTGASRVAVAMTLAAFLVASVVTPASAQEYRVYGTVTAELLHTWSEAEAATRLAAPLSASLAHSISGPSFDLSARTVLSAPPSGALSGGPYAAQITVPQLSLTVYPASWLAARIGRFDLDWGTTYVFTPGNDLALPSASAGTGATLDPAALAAGLTGGSSDAPGSVSGASVSVIPGPTTTLGLAASLPAPRPTTAINPWREVTVAAWADALLGGVEGFFGFQYRSGSVLRPSLGISLDLAGTIVAGEVAVELAKRYRYPTEALTLEPREGPGPVMALSIQRTFSGNDLSLNATAEYLYTGLGHSDAEADRFYDLVAVGYASAPGGAETDDLAPLGRQYVTAQVSLSWFNAAELSAGGLVNLGDGSFAAGCELTVIALDAIDVYVRSGLVWGESLRTEFGLLGTYTGTAVGVRLNL